MAEDFEGKTSGSTPEIKNEPAEKTVIESREGEKFFAERLASPEDPRVEKFQEMLENNFGKKEVDPLEVTKEAITETPPYLIHVAENSKGEIKGLNASAVIETVDAKGEASKKSATWFDCYTFMSPDAHGQGLAKKMFESQHESAIKDAESRGTEIKSWIAETHNNAEGFFESVGMRRVYSKDKEGIMREVAYNQMPLNWNEKTGNPAKGAGPVPEHLMMKMASGENKISAKDFKETVRGVYYYSSYWDREDFKTQKAYDKHVEYLEKMEADLFKSIGKKDLHLLSSAERLEMQTKGMKFIEHQTETEPEPKTKAEMKKEWREHFGVLAEVQLEQEKTARTAKRSEREWREHFGVLAEVQKLQEKELAAAKIPKESMETETILKEAGVQKPAESFREVQERLAERLDKGRTFEGKKLSESDKFVETRKFYLEELGYSIKYKGVLLDKAEILDENGRTILDDKGKALEFKSFYFSKTEKSINDFLSGKLKEKFEGKPAKELTNEEKMEAGYQKTVKAAENAQAEREAKITFLQKAENFGKEKWGKLTEGLARLNLREKWGIGLKEGKRLAIEGGRDLMAIGLSPAIAIKEAVREIKESFKLGDILERRRHIEEDIKTLEGVPAEKRSEDYKKLIETLKQASQIGAQKIEAKQRLLLAKEKILRFLDKQVGQLDPRRRRV